MKSDRRTSKLLLGAGLLFLLLAARFNFLTDDAFISFRYARNLVEGHGLVWNPELSGAAALEQVSGDAPERPVEGYSNLAWVLLVAAAQSIGIGPELASRGASLLAGLLLLWLLTRHLEHTRRMRPPGVPDGLPLPVSSASAAATLFLASAPPFVVWATGGLETMAFALALFGTFTAAERSSHFQAALWATLAVLLRADGLAWVGLVLAAGAFQSTPLRWRPRLGVLTIAALVCALQMAFRLHYYGDWLPNTARAKVSWSQLDGSLQAQFLERGLFYVLANLFAAPAVLAALLVGMRGLRQAIAPALVVAGGLGYCILVGGDFMAMGRFLVPSLPFVALLFAAGLDRFRPRSAAWLGAGAVALSLAAACDLSPFPRALRDRVHFRWNQPERPVSEIEMWQGMRNRTAQLSELGRALARHTPSAEVATYGPVGAVGYFSRHTIHDTYGLTSRVLLERSTLGQRLRSPGHDRQVEREALQKLPLSYLEASVQPAGTPLAPIPPGAPWRWEEFPLDPTDGFEPGRVLRILRLR